MDKLPEIGITDFHTVREAVRRVTGIALSDAKRSLVQSRLAKRLRQLGMSDFSTYADHLESHAAQEREALIEAITTHTTHFWREGHHFEDLVRLVLRPAAESRARSLRIWCAAASTGEEPYSLAITVAQHIDLKRCDAKILATDIDPSVLAEAESGVYDAQVADLKPDLRHFFAVGTGEYEGRVRVKKAVRDLVSFRRLNLVEHPWPLRPVFDAIFARNILIYFDGKTQSEVVAQLHSHLKPGGVLVLGHAESMLGVRAGMKPVGRGVFEVQD